MDQKSLYDRLGGYDGIAAFVDNVMPRLRADSQIGRFWQNRGDDGIAREKQLLIDYLSSSAGGPTHYTGRDMKLSHQGMKISEEDWSALLLHAGAAAEFLQIPGKECDEIFAFFTSLKNDIVDG